MLGDGSIEKPKTRNRKAPFSTAHGYKQKLYSYYIGKKLIRLNSRVGISRGHITCKTTGKIHDSYWVRCSSSSLWDYLYNLFYPNGEKIIPKAIYPFITKESLAFMYMDDGSIIGDSYKIATNCFTKDELQDFQYFLLKTFNLQTTIHKEHGLYIRKCSA